MTQLETLLEQKKLVPFEQGYYYISKKLHSLNAQYKNLTLLTIVPVNKKEITLDNNGERSYPTIVASGVNGSDYRSHNILHSNLNGKTYYLDKNNVLYLENNGVLCQVFAFTLPSKTPVTNQFVEKSIQGKQPFKVSKEFIKKSESMLPLDFFYSKNVMINSYQYVTFEIKTLGGNSTNYFSYRINSLKGSGDGDNFSNNIYIETYYPEVFQMIIDYAPKHLTVFRKKDYSQLTRRLEKLTVPVADTKYLSRYKEEFQKTIKKNNLTKIFKQKDIEYLDFTNVIESMPKAYIERLKRITLYHGNDSLHVIEYGNYSDKGTALGKEAANNFMKYSLEAIKQYLKNVEGLTVSSKEIATSPLGYYYIRNTTQALLTEIKKNY